MLKTNIRFTFIFDHSFSNFTFTSILSLMQAFNWMVDDALSFFFQHKGIHSQVCGLIIYILCLENWELCWWGEMVNALYILFSPLNYWKALIRSTSLTCGSNARWNLCWQIQVKTSIQVHHNNKYCI